MPATATRARRAYLNAASFVIRAITTEIVASVTAGGGPGGDELTEETLRGDYTTGRPWPAKVTFTLRLGRGRMWNPEIDNPYSPAREELLANLAAEGAQPLGWDNQVGPHLSTQNNWLLEPDAADGVEDGFRMDLSLLLFQVVLHPSCAFARLHSKGGPCASEAAHSALAPFGFTRAALLSAPSNALMLPLPSPPVPFAVRGLQHHRARDDLAHNLVAAGAPRRLASCLRLLCRLRHRGHRNARR